MRECDTVKKPCKFRSALKLIDFARIQIKDRSRESVCTTGIRTDENSVRFSSLIIATNYVHTLFAPVLILSETCTDHTRRIECTKRTWICRFKTRENALPPFRSKRKRASLLLAWSSATRPSTPPSFLPLRSLHC